MRTLAVAAFAETVPASLRREVSECVKAAAAAYGAPHLHAGIGLRRIPPFMECRVNRDLRLVFRREGDALVFHLCGTHDEVRDFLKNRR
jgi:hypothetical protein